MPITKVNNIPVINTIPSNYLLIEHLSEYERHIYIVHKILSYS